MSLKTLAASMVASLLLSVPFAATTPTASPDGSSDNICEYIPWWRGCY